MARRSRTGALRRRRRAARAAAFSAFQDYPADPVTLAKVGEQCEAAGLTELSLAIRAAVAAEDAANAAYNTLAELLDREVR